MVNTPTPYKYTNGTVRAIAARLSADRFAPYLQVSSGDEATAMRWYTFNTAASAAFYGPLQALEVVLRNRVADLLDTHFPGWLQGSNGLSGSDWSRVQDAENILNRRGKPVDRGRVIAELPFGFWTGLFAKRYDGTYWRQALYRAVPKHEKRRAAFDRLDRLRTLRNRIAHHERVLTRNLVDDHKRLMEVLGWLCADTHHWVDHHSRVLEVLSSPPEDIHRF